MATSGVYTLSRTLNEVANDVLDILQLVGDGETLSGDSVERVKSALNSMLKSWQAQGIHLWTYTEGTLFLEVGQEKYDFRESTTYAANEWFETTLTAATSALALTFTVSDADNITIGDRIGIIQNDNNLFWTTVENKAGLTITVPSPGITLAANSGAFVRNYRIATDTSPELIPISRVLDVRRQESADYEIPINFESREDYFNLPNKNQVGTPIQAYYSRQDLAGESSGIMYLWNAPSSSVPVINFTYERKIQIMVDADDTLDIPEYAQDALDFNLAKRVMLRFGVSPALALEIKEQAREYLDGMLSHDSAVYPVTINMQRNG